MEIKFAIIYHQKVVDEDISKLSKAIQTRVRKAIEEKLTTFPEVYGKPLRQSLSGYRKLRVGEYRVIFKIEKMTVSVFAIMHRSVVYDTSQKRVSKK